MIKQDISIIYHSKERCTTLGLDPTVIPSFSQSLSPLDLTNKVSKYKEIIDVINFFIGKFLSSVEGTPFLVLITDEEGNVLRLDGDSTMVDTINQLGIKEGVRFIEEDVGTNSISLALRHDQPIELIGGDHYHVALQGAACYSVPFRYKGNIEPIGTLTLFTFIPFDNPLYRVLLCTIVDSIERELLVRQNNRQLYILNQVLLETSYQAVMITNASGEIIDWNEKSKQILNSISADVREGSSLLAFEYVGSYFKKVLVDQQECIGVELSLPIDGVPHFFIMDVIPIFNDKHKLIRAVGSLRDISEMKNTEELLRNTEKLSVVGQLAAGVAHEIRNPLTTIKGLLQLSRDQFQPEHYKLLMSEIDRMNFIVSEFLVLGKPHIVEYREVDCLSVLNDILKIFETQAMMIGVSIVTDIRNYGTIYCDPNQIKQVFINILKNALEAMPDGGNIEILVDIQGANQLFRFKDNGEGIEDELLKKLGQPFCSTKQNGNGLGVMVTQRIIHSHKGEITFTSEVKSGTTVDILLPLITPPKKQ